MESNSAVYQKILSSTGGARKPMMGVKKLGSYNKPVVNKLGYYNYNPVSKLGMY
jgi:hypothetical protein